MAYSGLIALDIDGTLIGPHGISPGVKAAAADLEAAGWAVMLATGRSILSTVTVAEELGLGSEYAVCSNGAVTVRLGPGADQKFEIIHKVTFDPTPAVTRLLREAPDVLCGVEIENGLFKTNGEFPMGLLAQAQDYNVVSFDELVSSPTTRVVIHSPEQSSQEFIDLAGRVGLSGVTYAVGTSAWLDITGPGVSKAFALEHVRADLGIDRDKTVAIGDGFNDIEMFRWAERSFAMGNAVPDVQTAAGAVTASIHEDGAALAMRSLVESAA